MIFSIVIPARNESKYIGACLESIERTVSHSYAGQTEIIVVLNRCTDSTEAIALAHGAKVIRDDSKNLAKIRNAGAKVASGEILVTIDADSTMSPNMLEEIDKHLTTGKYIGGGVPIWSERFSAGIFLTALLIYSFLPFGISAGLFWCRRSDFNAIGGFNEELRIAEDVDFAKRLKAHGKKQRKRFGALWKTHITTSCRKFDKLGDWYLIRNFFMLWQAIHGIDNGVSDRLFYDFER